MSNRRRTLLERTNDPFSRGWMTCFGLLMAGVAFAASWFLVGFAALAACVLINTRDR